jgi:hypothetical protein
MMISSDADFEEFYQTFGQEYRRNIKKNAERCWKVLSDSERALAVENAPLYNKEHPPGSQWRCNADTYLTSKKFNHYINIRNKSPTEKTPREIVLQEQMKSFFGDDVIKNSKKYGESHI